MKVCKIALNHQTVVLRRTHVASSLRQSAGVLQIIQVILSLRALPARESEGNHIVKPLRVLPELAQHADDVQSPQSHHSGLA